jgi:transposase
MTVEKKKRRRYTAEFKREAVQLLTEQGYTDREAARSLGIPHGMVSRWRKEQLQKQQNAFPGTGHQYPEVEELNRLREENRRLKLEREILKKAAAFFARESG